VVDEDVDGARTAAEDALLSQGRPSQASGRAPDHWDLLVPLLPLTALHHLNASSGPLGGGWVGTQPGAALVLELRGLADYAASTMARSECCHRTLALAPIMILTQSPKSLSSDPLGQQIAFAQCAVRIAR
jgi:hypothetical protein